MGEKNYGKSVRAKLLNISKAEKLGYQLIVIRYIQERLLYRLSQSRFREKLFLKGGALLYALGTVPGTSDLGHRLPRR